MVKSLSPVSLTEMNDRNLEGGLLSLLHLTEQGPQGFLCPSTDFSPIIPVIANPV